MKKQFIAILFLVTLFLVLGCQKEKEEIYDDSKLRGREYINEAVTIKVIYNDVRRNKTINEEAEVKDVVDIISDGEVMNCDEPVLYGYITNTLKLYDKENKLIDEVGLYISKDEARAYFKSDNTCYRLKEKEQLKDYVYEESVER